MAGCSGNKNNALNEDMPKPLEVELSVPETAGVKEAVVLKATVTYGEEKVEDADEVVFEIWEEGKKSESEMLDSTNKGDGTYEANTSFEQDGVFEVQVHVTAKQQHNMPKSSIQVGEGTSEAHHEHGDHEHSEDFSMHFMNPDKVEINQETKLVVHVQNEETPLEKARVRFEIWNDAISEKHDFIDTIESKAGEYEATFTFPEKGTYDVKIHVENDDGLHEHEEYKVEVQ